MISQPNGENPFLLRDELTARWVISEMSTRFIQEFYQRMGLSVPCFLVYLMDSGFGVDFGGYDSTDCCKYRHPCYRICHPCYVPRSSMTMIGNPPYEMGFHGTAKNGVGRRCVMMTEMWHPNEVDSPRLHDTSHLLKFIIDPEDDLYPYWCDRCNSKSAILLPSDMCVADVKMIRNSL